MTSAELSEPFDGGVTCSRDAPLSRSTMYPVSLFPVNREIPVRWRRGGTGIVIKECAVFLGCEGMFYGMQGVADSPHRKELPDYRARTSQATAEESAFVSPPLGRDGRLIRMSASRMQKNYVKELEPRLQNETNVGR